MDSRIEYAWKLVSVVMEHWRASPSPTLPLAAQLSDTKRGHKYNYPWKTPVDAIEAQFGVLIHISWNTSASVISINSKHALKNNPWTWFKLEPLSDFDEAKPPDTPSPLPWYLSLPNTHSHLRVFASNKSISVWSGSTCIAQASSLNGEKQLGKSWKSLTSHISMAELLLLSDVPSVSHDFQRPLFVLWYGF